MKLSKKWNKVITLFSLATIGMSVIVTPISTTTSLIVHADVQDDDSDNKDTENKENEESSSKGSQAISNPAIRNAYINRSKYNFATQYAVTRNYLQGTFLNNPDYAGLYTSGVQAKSVSKTMGKYIKNDVVIGQSADLTKNQEANTSLSNVDTENSNKDIYPDLARELSGKITDELINQINTTYQIKPGFYGKTDSLWGTSVFGYKTTYFTDGNNFTKPAGNSKEHIDILKQATTEYIYKILTNVKNASTTVKSELVSKITNELQENMYYATFGDSVFAHQKGNNFAYLEITEDGINYPSLYTNKSLVGGKQPKGLLTNKKANLNVTKSWSGILTPTLEKSGKTFTVSDSTSSDAKKSKEDGASYLNGLFMYTRLPKSQNKKNAEDYNAKMKKAIANNKDSIDKLAENLSSVNSEIIRDGSLLSYTPMYLGVDSSYDIFEKDAYKNVISKSADLSLGADSDVKLTDGTSATFSQITDMNGEDRALQIQDLILDKNGKTNSNVMTGDTKSVRGKAIIKSNGDSPIASKDGRLNQYLGIYYGDSKSSKRKMLTSGNFKSGLTATLSDSTPTTGTVLYKALTASGEFRNTQSGNLQASESIIATAMDNYGNLIASETGDIVIPYWQNELFLNNKNLISANVALKKNSKFLENAVLNNTDFFNLGNIRKEAVKKAKESKDIVNSDELVDKFNKFISTDNNTLERAFYTKIASGSITNEELDTLAMMITLVSKDSVKDYNDRYIKALEGEATFYVYPTNTDFMSQEDYDNMKLSRWTASSLIQKIGWLIDYGIWEVIRLTIAQIAVNLYDSIVSWAGNVFYNDNITETYTWKNIINALATLMFAFMILYLGYVAYGIFTRRVTLKDVVKKTLFLVLVIFIPYSGYNMVTNAIINKPSELVLNNIVKQSMVVNFLEDKQSNQQIASDDMKQAYEELFGSNKSNNEFTTKNYMLTFYTTTNREGIDVTDLKAVEQSENGWFKSNTKTLNTLTNQYNKNKLVSIQASMFDLYVWSTNQVYYRVGIPDYLQDYYDKNPEVFNDEIRDETFFQYLERTYNRLNPDDNPYAGISQYTEYSIDMSMLYDSDALKQGVFQDNINKTNLGKITASELFYELQKNSLNSTNLKNPQSALQDGLKDLVNIINLFNIDYKYTEKEGFYIPTSDDYDELIRDFSMVKSTRKQAYGKSDSLNYSDFTLSVLGKSKKFNIPIEAQQTYAPKEDYFGVYTTISNLMKSQNEISNARYKNAQTSTYKVVSNTLGTVAGKYANIGQVLSVNTDDVNTNSALQMSVLMELYFNMTKELGMKNFPQTYEPESVSFDSLLKQVYIPLSQYDFQSYTVSDLLVTNLIEYITLTENSFFVILVFIAIILVFAFWMVYWFVFKFVMLILVMYKFVKEYLILGNYSNKSWLGTLYIYGIMGLARLGLAVIWWLGYSIINSAFASYGGLIYNIAFVHSLAIIVYIIFAFKKVFIPLLKSVMEDKENLGANSITSKLESIKGNLSMKGLALKGAKGIGNSAGRNLRRGKNFGRGSANVIKKLASKVGGSSVKVARFAGDTKAVRSMQAKMVNGAESALRNRGAYGNFVADKIFNRTKKSFTEEERLIEKAKGNGIKNAVGTYQLLKNRNKQDKLAKKMSNKNISFGDVLNTANNATQLGATMLELSNLPQNILVNHGAELLSTLASKGIVAKIVNGFDSEGNSIKKLDIDTTAFDMTSADGREASLIDIQNFAKEKIIESNRKFVSGDVSELESFNTELPLYSIANNSDILLDTTMANGIDYNTVDSVFYKSNLAVDGLDKELKSLKSKFNFEPVTWFSDDGKEITSSTKFRMIPKSKMSQNEIKKSMSDMKKIDDSVRARFNKQLMNTSEDKNLKYEQFNFTDPEKEMLFKDFVEKSGISYISDESGSGKIVYDGNNRQARNAVATFKDTIKQSQKDNQKDFRLLDANLGAFASKGEGNGVFETNLYNSKENTHEINKAFGAGHASKNAYVVAMDKDNDENSKKLHNALVIASASSKLSGNDDFKEAIEIKDKNRKIIKTGLNKAMNNDNKLLNDSLEYISEHDQRLRNSPVFKSVLSDYQKYTADLESKNITEEKYKEILPFLANQTTEMLESSSLIEGFSSTVDFDKAGVNISNKERDSVIKDIVSSKEKIKESLNLADIKDVDRHNIDSNYMDKVSTLFGKGGEVVYNKFNNTAVIKTDKELDVSNGNIADALLNNEYNKLLNAKLDNDSPLITKYMQNIPDYKKTPEELKNVVKKEIENGTIGIDDVLNSGKDINSKKSIVVTPETNTNIQKTVIKNFGNTSNKLKEVDSKIKDKLSEGYTLSKDKQQKYDTLTKTIRRIKLEQDEIGVLENDAKLIEINNRINNVNKELNKFSSEL